MKKHNLLKKSCYTIVTLGATISPAFSQVAIHWNDASGSDAIGTWLHTIIVAIMGCFIMASMIVGALAFKGLASDGNWKDFWSKIAGAVGMFIVPTAISYLLTKS